MTKLGLDVYVVSRTSKESLKAKLAREICGKYISTSDISVDKLGDHIDNVDVIIEATGSSEVVLKAVNSLGKNGIMAVTGIPPRNMELSLNADKIVKKMVLDNNVIFGVVNANRRHYEAAVNHIYVNRETWVHILKRMITKVIKLDEVPNYFRNPYGNIKTIVEIN